jgi:hypothetical protein
MPRTTPTKADCVLSLSLCFVSWITRAGGGAGEAFGSLESLENKNTIKGTRLRDQVDSVEIKPSRCGAPQVEVARGIISLVQDQSSVRHRAPSRTVQQQPQKAAACVAVS